MNDSIRIVIKVGEWISVTERLPADLSDVLFFYETDIGQKDISIGHYEKGIWSACGFYHSRRLSDAVKVTHWMPLPEDPNE